jgi:activator of HSP90 ATPase
MKTKNIQQSVSFKAAPHRVYELLMDSRKHARITGAPARISRKPGGRFTAFDSYISGVNIELVPDKRIVQAWRGSDWPEGHYSLVFFSLSKVRGGTRLNFIQIGVPEKECKDISAGWREFYWGPIKKMLESS